MSNPAYVKSDPGKWASEGVRVAQGVDLSGLTPNSITKAKIIIEAMDWPQLIIFTYDKTDRVVAPFVLGVSSQGNPLMRGYQLEGVSRGGPGPGWRVFQLIKMDRLESHQDFFNKEDFNFDEKYPWIYKVLKML